MDEALSTRKAFTRSPRRLSKVARPLFESGTGSAQQTSHHLYLTSKAADEQTADPASGRAVGGRTGAWVGEKPLSFSAGFDYLPGSLKVSGL